MIKDKVKVLLESISINLQTLEDVANGKLGMLSQDEENRANWLIDFYHETEYIPSTRMKDKPEWIDHMKKYYAEQGNKKDVIRILQMMDTVKRMTERLLGPVPWYNEKDLVKRIIGRERNSMNPDKWQDWFPIPVYVSAKKDDPAGEIGIQIHLNGRKTMFEGNDEAEDETYALVNKLTGNTKPVQVWGSHGKKVIDYIQKYGKLPSGLYVSPKKDVAEGYWGQDRILFTGIIDSSNVRQESDIDWKVIGTPIIKQVRIY